MSTDKGHRRKFDKKPVMPNELLKKLEERGLNIENKQEAENYLNCVGFYRLKSYYKPYYEENKKIFKSGITFLHIIRLYEFDRQLRILALDAIERIEVFIRQTISEYMLLEFSDNPFWFTHEKVFTNKDKCIKFCELATKSTYGRNSKGPRLKHYYDTYETEEPNIPPSWILFEELSLGTVLDLLFDQLNDDYRRKIISNIRLPSYSPINNKEKELKSWLYCFKTLRNVVAHHNPLWNLKFHFPTGWNLILDAFSHRQAPKEKNAQGYMIFIVLYRLLICVSNSREKRLEWVEKLYETLEKTCPSEIKREMNFPQDWKRLPFWKK
ncbi:MAG: Abi family protein [Acetobacter sp.]|nr:Abi family protein [Acetobacter sp.]